MDKLRYSPPGSAPATLIVPPEYERVKPVISLFEYDAYSWREYNIETIDDLLPYLESEKISWINIDGMGDTEFFRQLALHFRIHPLALEDMLNLGQRSKVDHYDRQLFIVLHLAHESGSQEVIFEQVSMILSERVVITVQERSGNVLDPVRQRLRDGVGNARFMKADYLVYALIDAVIDQYFPIIESLSDSMDAFQKALSDQPTRERLNELHKFRRLIARVSRAVWPQRDLLNQLARDESGLIAERTKPFFRDCYDNAVVIMETLESFRDETRNFMDLFLTNINMWTNEIIRVLTVVISIFLPLTFIVGIYGMNFERPFGYFFALALMFTVAVGMIVYFKRKKWL